VRRLLRLLCCGSYGACPVCLATGPTCCSPIGERPTPVTRPICGVGCGSTTRLRTVAGRGGGGGGWWPLRATSIGARRSGPRSGSSGGVGGQFLFAKSGCSVTRSGCRGSRRSLVWLARLAGKEARSLAPSAQQTFCSKQQQKGGVPPFRLCHRSAPGAGVGPMRWRRRKGASRGLPTEKENRSRGNRRRFLLTRIGVACHG